MFPNPFWQALTTEHAAIAVGEGLARRYPADVIPFAGVADTGEEAMRALRDLLEPGEAIYVAGDKLELIPGLEQVREIAGYQMSFSSDVMEPGEASAPPIELLASEHASDMVGLTDVAFPGFFRKKTHVLGSYWGIRRDGKLVAMAGERVALPGFREISAVCTHPSYTGKGYAAVLIRHILRVHSVRALRSFLHVAAANERAISLYERLGFVKTETIIFRQIRRPGPR
ncbi:GNAT family N-acetyltransferase [Edaphobacter modestus]|uniref:FR47-like protein n=1 Tax=Edaphobacter modestus TaxID=388466 RepID=A0A4Q7YSC2_9BACT|nr:GNAT family N-acetyltransferase [Edaphobacter modestus]RZU39799.1 FR47-like protein [Edaphobacter modestus]